jgi:hypothetical protein
MTKPSMDLDAKPAVLQPRSPAAHSLEVPSTWLLRWRRPDGTEGRQMVDHTTSEALLGAAAIAVAHCTSVTVLDTFGGQSFTVGCAP